VVASRAVGAPGPDVEREKRAAAEHSASLVEDGTYVGLGTGSTVAYLLPALAGRRLDLRCVATSIATERKARELGLTVEQFEGPDSLDHLDIAIDGADQVDDAGWVVKGGGAAHTREKRVASAADRFVIIVDSGKLVDGVHAPVPLELMDFGLAATLRDLRALGDVTLRDVPRSPDDGIIADFHGDVTDPVSLAAGLDAAPGVIAHGLFPPAMTSDVLIGRGDQVERRPAPG
jgi:ribose 5-phosphate isomerase A